MISVAVASPPSVPKTTNGVVVCLATGPSLTQEDVDYCRGKGLVIAINDAHRLAPWADILYSSDAYWWHYHRLVPEFAGVRVGLTRPGEPAHLKLPPPIVVFSARQEDGLDMTPDRISHTKNSGGAAINLAVHAGAQRVVLLGYDMANTNGQRHFFGEHPKPIQRHRDSLYKTFCDRIATMVPHLEARGVEVVNCSRATALTCFPRRPLTEAL